MTSVRTADPGSRAGTEPSDSPSDERRSTTDDPYVIRPYEPRDRDAFVELYNDTFGGGSDRWFEWKYLDNPNVSHVPIVVADADGELAGARPQVPFRMRVGDTTVLAFRFGDTMVHPDHRRRGVFTRLAERVLDEYSRTAPVFGFNCPNEIARKGFRKVGGRVIGTLPSFYRVQHPSTMVSRREAIHPERVAPVASALVRGHNRLRDLTAPGADDVSVYRHAKFPTRRLASLYRRAVPDRVHAVRDEAFLRWRYRNPMWEYTAYTAERAGETLAGVVTGTRTWDGHTVTNVVDVLPLVPTEQRREGLSAALAAVVKENGNADVLAYSGRTIPRSLLARFGFVADDSLPLSRVASPTRLVAYDVSDGGGWAVDDVDLRRTENWLLTYAELDAR